MAELRKPHISNERRGFFIPDHKGFLKRLEPLSKNIIILISLIFLLFLKTGCIVLPIPTEEKVLEGTPVNEDKSKLLEIGVTSKDDVIRLLGDPRIIWEEARLFVYDWETSSWFIIGLFAGGYSARGVAGDISDKYVLLIQFDERDKICRFQKLKRPSEDNRYGNFLKEWVNENKSEIN